MTTFIQAIALAILITIIILIVKWQVDNDIKKMQKRLDDARKEINKKAKVMSKDITEKILLKAGFHKTQEEGSLHESYDLVTKDNAEISVSYYPIVPKREYRCWAYVQGVGDTHTDIQTVGHFNMLMDILGIDFKLKEE